MQLQIVFSILIVAHALCTPNTSTGYELANEGITPVEDPEYRGQGYREGDCNV
jgi:hypothetical protein